MLICFDRPRRWFNKLWCVAFDQHYAHVRILLPCTKESCTHNSCVHEPCFHEYMVLDYELTWDGCYDGAMVDVRENFPNLDTVVRIPISPPVNIEHMDWVFRTIRRFRIRWSTWTALTALLTGSFPGFTCASATWYALTGFINHNITPDEIYEELENEMFWY